MNIHKQPLFAFFDALAYLEDPFIIGCLVDSWFLKTPHLSNLSLFGLQMQDLIRHPTSNPALVDRPTQLIGIWIFICCQHTNTKDIAGQSANPIPQ